MRSSVCMFVCAALVASFVDARPPPPPQDPVGTNTVTDDLERLLLELLHQREQAVQMPIKMSDLLPNQGIPLRQKRQGGKDDLSAELFPIKMSLLHELEAVLFPIKMDN